MKKIRIGVPVHGFIAWGGGIDYLRTIIDCLDDYPEGEIHLIFPFRLTLLDRVKQLRRNILCLFGSERKKLLSLQSSKVFAQSNFYEDLKNRYPIHIIDSTNKSLGALARNIKIDVLLPLISPLPHDFPVPWVGWVADFQHHYLPENFSINERNHRDAIFSKMFTNCKSVIVGAKLVKQDINKLYPNSSVSIFVVPTIANPKREWLIDKPQILNQYGIKKNYFIVCNQFWKHKNHITLFEAFAQFSLLNSDVDLICTGELEDYRDPQYIDMLKNFLKKSKLKSRVHVLGLIPKLDQIELLKSAVALIQPTLFEGGPGGGSVYDAIALGKVCMVSNIPINLEIEHENTHFFDPHKPEELSVLMQRIYNQYSKSVFDETELVKKGQIRKSFALKALVDAVECATSTSRPSKASDS